VLVLDAMDLGLCFIVTTAPAGMKGFETLTKKFRDTQLGLILGNPSEQTMLQAQVARNYKATPDIGLWYKRGEIGQVKMPLV